MAGIDFYHGRTSRKINRLTYNALWIYDLTLM